MRFLIIFSLFFACTNKEKPLENRKKPTEINEVLKNCHDVDCLLTKFGKLDKPFEDTLIKYFTGKPFSLYKADSLEIKNDSINAFEYTLVDTSNSICISINLSKNLEIVNLYSFRLFYRKDNSYLYGIIYPTYYSKYAPTLTLLGNNPKTSSSTYKIPINKKTSDNSQTAN